MADIINFDFTLICAKIFASDPEKGMMRSVVQ
jgi:hypothetical protein